MKGESGSGLSSPSERTPLLTGGSNLQHSMQPKRASFYKSKSFAGVRQSLRNQQQHVACKAGTLHSYWYSLVNARSRKTHAVIFRIAITSLILLDVMAYILQSDENIDRTYKTYFQVLEGTSSLIFLFEYVVRVATVPSRSRFARTRPVEARLAWICSWESVIDLVALSPWFIEQIAGRFASLSQHSAKGNAWQNLPNFQWLRVLRLFRMFRNSRIIEAFEVLARVVYFNYEILTSALIICGVLILLTSMTLYHLAPHENLEEDYSSILATMYLSVMMLTGQGQPEGELPWYTKLVCCITAIFAVAQFAIPASMLTWGFEQEAALRIKKAAERRGKKAAQILRGDVDFESTITSSSSDDDRLVEWKEYEHEVTGSPDNSENEAADTSVLTLQDQARMLKIFSTFDKDESGKISCAELSAHNLSRLHTQLDADGDGFTTGEEFTQWLCDVKRTQRKQVFEAVLQDLEERAVRQRATYSTPADMGNALMAFANQFRDMEKELSTIREQLRLKDLEIEHLRNQMPSHRLS